MFTVYGKKHVDETPEILNGAARMFATEIFHAGDLDERIRAERVRIQEATYSIAIVDNCGPVAAITAVIEQTFTQDDILDIDRLAVKRQYQQHKLGTWLIYKLLTLHTNTSSPVNVAHVDIHDDGRGQTRFYEECGFTLDAMQTSRDMASRDGRFAYCANVMDTIATSGRLSDLSQVSCKTSRSPSDTPPR